MNLRKRESLPLNIENVLRDREKGQVGWTVGIFFTLFLGVILCAMLQIERYRAACLYLEDALAASNLASAVIDVEEYGISHKILIADPEEAYDRYRLAVKGNLNLDDFWRGQDGSLVRGPVSIVQYIVYNVEADGVTAYHFDEEGKLTWWQEIPGNTVAPNGILVENTSVYSEIAFEMTGMFGVAVRAHKANLADITK